jgi:hypothetical protein
VQTAKEKLDIEIISYHGWGFDSSFWRDWKTIVSEGVLFKTADRGYFLDEKLPEFSASTKQKAVFVHSYGLHGLPVTHYEECWSFISAMIPIFQHDGNYRRKRHQQNSP